jgi:hypothetical protein
MPRRAVFAQFRPGQRQGSGEFSAGPAKGDTLARCDASQEEAAMPAKPKPDQKPSARKSGTRARTQSEADRKKKQNALLDEGLQETFPASDPVSVVQIK